MAVIAVKNVTVKRVDHLDASWLSDQRPPREPAIHERRRSAHRSRLGCVRVHYVRLFRADLTIDLKKGNNVLGRQLAAEFGYEPRRDAVFRGEVAHVLFAIGNRPGDQYALKFCVLKATGQPNHMSGRATDIEACDDAEDLHSENDKCRPSAFAAL